MKQMLRHTKSVRTSFDSFLIQQGDWEEAVIGELVNVYCMRRLRVPREEWETSRHIVDNYATEPAR